VASALDRAGALIASLSPARRRLIYVLGLFLLWRATLAIVGLMAHVAIVDPTSGKVTFPGSYLWDIWLRWDSQWYVAIAREGYAPRADRMSNVAFFPLFPYLARGFGWLFGSPEVGGLVVVNLALLGAPPPPASQPWAGLLLDTWPELLPSAEEDAGVVFHFDAPRAEAPQAVLLAVPSQPWSGPAPPKWSYDELERILFETLALARMRALDLGHLGRYGQLVPMTFLAANLANEAVSTSFTDRLAADATIAQE